MSQSREDYIKYIFEAGGHNYVSNKDIANGLKVAPPSVSEMISKLAQDELVTYQPYHGVALTPKGMNQAKELIRKHEIWEYFLEKVLAYQPDEVHDLAEILEHATPLDLANRLADYIHFPEKKG